MSATRRLFLVRHGLVDFDSEDFLETPRGRQWDPPLAEEGRDQSGLLAARFALMDPPPTVFSSPFRRCRETIEPYASREGIEVEVDGDVGEVFVGEWEGVSFEEIISGDEELARKFRDQEAMFGLAPGGETGSDLKRRVVPGVESMLDRAQGDVLVVTHGGVINAYLGSILGIGEDMFFLPDNASINTVFVEGERRRVRFLNDVRHITDPAIFVPPAGAETS